MKLLLTSNGLSNESLRNTLRKLVKGQIKIAFIPTASNVVDEEKSWLINDLNNCNKVGSVDIVDISALPKSVWLPRLKKANVIVVGGGNSIYLMECIVSSGLKEEILALLKNRIYIGISAGSTVSAKTLNTSSKILFADKKKNASEGLGLVDFYIRPHLNSPKFPKCNDKNLKKLVGRIHGNVYAIDDKSGILVDGDKISVISEGEWKLYKEKMTA